ncbi:MAG: hypothetical protein ACFFDF_00385 [Candidatus Odinarchaeota archaeon]
MFDIKPDERMTTVEKLLYNIYEELKGKSEKKDTKLKSPQKKSNKKCKYCGQVHENHGYFLACARKHKKAV